VRRLTSAEYAYTIEDLTGLDLNLERDFVSDAVGGEGFTNVGGAQFVQDSTLERYLEAAKRISNHAVIGAGELQFFRDPGKTGLELSAITRIQQIYHDHGFRAAAGEGAVPYGLDRYPKAFFTAWRFLHRERLGRGGASLAQLAAEEKLSPRLAQHVWSVLTGESPSYPTSEIVARWRKLPQPSGPDGELPAQVRTECAEICHYMRTWQSRLVDSVMDREEAAILSENSVQAVPSRLITARIAWPYETKTIRVELAVVPADPESNVRPVVVWHNPRLRWRRMFGRREEPQPLANVLPAGSAAAFAFGNHPHGAAIEAGDFVTVGVVSRSLELPIPADARGLEVLVEPALDLVHGESCVIRCEISGSEMLAGERPISALLADPAGAAFIAWKAGVVEFARLLPQVSHREPAPSDRDPIPPPFGSEYNTRERDYFHYKVKYHRDDQFLVEKILDDATLQRLDEAWSDLLGSFEYHDILLRFLAEKYGLDLGGRTVAGLDEAWIERQPAEHRQYLRHLRQEQAAIQQAFRAAEARHVTDALELAARAWRRPLSGEEQHRLRSFYDSLRNSAGLDHAQAVRALVARILMAPDFLYRAERPAEGSGDTPLSDWELASRLSYFLWSSLPDEELRRAAAAGELRRPEQLAAQARRMLKDERARRLATEFFGQWLGFYQFDRYRGVDPQRFPEFTEKLRAALYDEAVSFFGHIVRDDRPVSEMLFADYLLVNRDLAAHYGIDADVTETTLSHVEDASRYHRGGLLGLGAVLTVTSAPLRTSPVKRGDWILRRILGTPVPPPPADAGSIPADDVSTDGPKTAQQRLEAHRRNATCANCHSRIDPLGFALEHYDALGRWRDAYRDGAAIDPSGTLSDGTRIVGASGLKSYLKQQEPQFQRNLCVKLLGYALGRGELITDEALIDQMLAGLRDGEDRFSDLVVKIVTSHQFCYHRGQDPGESRENEQ
jgi:hypothetical protein